MQIEAKLQALGIVLPEAPKIPPGIKISFAWTRVRGNRVYVAGHAAQTPMARQPDHLARCHRKSHSNMLRKPHATRRWPSSVASSANSAISTA